MQGDKETRSLRCSIPISLFLFSFRLGKIRTSVWSLRRPHDAVAVAELLLEATQAEEAGLQMGNGISTLSREIYQVIIR